MFFIAKMTTITTLQYAKLSGNISELECRRDVSSACEKMCSQEVRMRLLNNLVSKKVKIDGSNCNKWLLSVTS